MKTEKKQARILNRTLAKELTTADMLRINGGFPVASTSHSAGADDDCDVHEFEI
jgi:hypothetical protein